MQRPPARREGYGTSGSAAARGPGEAGTAAARRCPAPRHRQGFAVLFTGLSGAGKSTLAHGVAALLRERAGPPVTLLDGDSVRRRLSGGLGFSRADRAAHLGRVGFVAAEVARHGGIALCAVIAPWAADRRALRATVEAHGGFVEVHVSTPLATCEARDPRGLYARARAGLLEGFTGIDDPFEAPERPDLAVDTADTAPDAAARHVLATLECLGYVRAPAGRGAGTGGAKEAVR